jgi:hypothetical protein
MATPKKAVPKKVKTARKRVVKSLDEKKADALKAFIIAKLRNASRKWPPIYEAKKRQRREVIVVSDGKGCLQLFTQGKLFKTIKDDGRTKCGNRVMYECEICHELFFDKIWFKATTGKWRKTSAVALDHIEPCVPLDQLVWDWDTYIMRMFTSPMQLLCKACHSEKTSQENAARAEFKRRPSCT